MTETLFNPTNETVDSNEAQQQQFEQDRQRIINLGIVAATETIVASYQWKRPTILAEFPAGEPANID